MTTQAMSLYEQIADRIREEILGGVLRPGDRLPTERELGNTFNASRGTVRQALTRLADEGLVRRTQGSGTYVLASSPMSRFFSLSTFDDEMRSLGRIPSTRVLRAETIAAHADDAVRLDISPGEPVHRIDRLRLADNRPMAVEHRVLPARLCPALLEEDLEHQSIHWLLTSKYAIPIARIEHTVDRRPVTERAAGALGIDTAEIVMEIERLTYTEDRSGRRPAVWFRATHRIAEGRPPT
jgi:GntR family transcriptional regulator